MKAVPSRRLRLRALLSAIGASLVATAIVWYLFGLPTAGVDDANIFFSYAHNLSEGNGFVFNAGGERVEGFTSLLWVLLCAAAVKLFSHPEAALLAAGVMLMTAVAALCIGSPVVRRGSAPSAAWPLVFLVLLFSDARFVAWNTLTLMETPLWCCLLTISALLTFDDRIPERQLSGLLAGTTAALVLTRPEAIVWSPIAILLVYARQVMGGRSVAPIRAVAPAVIAYAGALGGLTIFRVLYFGYPLPNTFYAKVSPSLSFTLAEGFRYLSDYVFSGAMPLLSVVAVIISALHLLKAGLHDQPTFALTVLAGAGLLMPVLTGGDHFGGFRFYQAMYPIFLLALINCVRFVFPQYARLPKSGPSLRTISLIAGALTASAFIVVQALEWTDIDQRTQLRHEFHIAEAGRRLGSAAGQVFVTLPRPPSIGTITVGGLKYAYDADVVDLMGLNNTTMAHNGGTRIGLRAHAAFEKPAFYELRPLIVVPAVQSGGDIASLQKRDGFVDTALKGLIDDPLFRTLYRVAEVKRDTPSGTVRFAGWYDRMFLDTLQRRSEFEVVLGSPGE